MEADEIRTVQEAPSRTPELQHVHLRKAAIECTPAPVRSITKKLLSQADGTHSFETSNTNAGLFTSACSLRSSNCSLKYQSCFACLTAKYLRCDKAHACQCQKLEDHVCCVVGHINNDVQSILKVSSRAEGFHGGFNIKLRNQLPSLPSQKSNIIRHDSNARPHWYNYKYNKTTRHEWR